MEPDYPAAIMPPYTGKPLAHMAARHERAVAEHKEGQTAILDGPSGPEWGAGYLTEKRK